MLYGADGWPNTQRGGAGTHTHTECTRLPNRSDQMQRTRIYHHSHSTERSTPPQIPPSPQPARLFKMHPMKIPLVQRSSDISHIEYIYKDREIVYSPTTTKTPYTKEDILAASVIEIFFVYHRSYANARTRLISPRNRKQVPLSGENILHKIGVIGGWFWLWLLVWRILWLEHKFLVCVLR